jgi:hypothetical protein
MDDATFVKQLAVIVYRRHIELFAATRTGVTDDTDVTDVTDDTSATPIPQRYTSVLP